MSDFERDRHYGAVNAAKEAIGEVQGTLSVLREQIENALGLVANATGGNSCPMESGRNAFEFTAGLIDEQETLFQHTTGIVHELERYAGGF